MFERRDERVGCRLTKTANAAAPTTSPRASAEVLLGSVLQRVVAELNNTTRQEDREKHVWLFNRIAPRLGISQKWDSA